MSLWEAVKLAVLMEDSWGEYKCVFPITRNRLSVLWQLIYIHLCLLVFPAFCRFFVSFYSLYFTVCCFDCVRLSANSSLHLSFVTASVSLLIHSSASVSPSLFLCPTQAVNQAGAGPHSEQVSFRTPATNPDPVSSLALLDLPTSSESGHSPSTCLLLKWDEPNSNGAEISSYVITLDVQTITVESGTSHLVTDLQPDSEYRYWDLCG